MTQLLTTAQVADTLGTNVRRVRQLARQLRVGTALSPRVIVYTARDVDRMRPHITGIVGRPKRG